MTNNEDHLIDAASVRAEFGGKSPMTLHRWIKQGILPAPVKINGRNYWRRSEVTAIKAGQARGAA